jgi:phage terminase large subunit-like protein
VRAEGPRRDVAELEDADHGSLWMQRDGADPRLPDVRRAPEALPRLYRDVVSSLVRGHRSEAERLVALPTAERAKAIRSMSDEDIEALMYDWKFWARPEQLPPPGNWTTWASIAGRGAGKTRLAAEFVRTEIEEGRAKYPILIGADAGDVRDVMVEGESGLLTIAPPWFRPKYEPSKRRLVYPNGVVASLFGAHDPDSLRGPQSDLVWGDEIGKWKYPQEAWDNMAFGNRLGNPRRVVTTTPKPIRLIRWLMGFDHREHERRGTKRGIPPRGVVIGGRMSTYDNLANLAPKFAQEMLDKYQGTRIGRQELMGDLLLDVPGALWTLEMIERDRVRPEKAPRLSDFERLIVGVDPAVTSGEGSNETGIILAGKTANGHFWILIDDSGRHPAIAKSPEEKSWARIAVDLYRRNKADRVVGEVNNGGDLVEATIRQVDENVSYKAVHASRGKRKRGEPVASLYEQRRVHHVGAFDALEDQMITWVPKTKDEPSETERDPSAAGVSESPDRADALVWTLTELAGIVADDHVAPPASTGRRGRR